MPLGPADGPVCVTGATGFCAAFIVRDLLAAGYTVHGTVRSLAAGAKTAPLLLPGASQRLTLFEADLLDGKEVWAAALRGCTACIHTAAPVEVAGDGAVHWRDLADAHERQVKPAVEGTVAVLSACVEEHIQRVVLTSSLSAVGTAREPFPVLDESCWSEEDYLEETLLTDGGAAYELAKTRQERVAWAMAEEHGFELRVICPSVIFGPLLTSHLNFSHELLLSVLQGKGSPFRAKPPPGMIQNAVIPMVDVREVSQAHILALTDDSAAGRYLLISACPHYEDICRVVSDAFGGATVIPSVVEGSDVVPAAPKQGPVAYDSSKMREQLGVAEVSMEECVVASVEALIGLGQISLQRRGEGAEQQQQPSQARL